MKELNQLANIVGSVEAVKNQPKEAIVSIRDLAKALGIPHPLFAGLW